MGAHNKVWSLNPETDEYTPKIEVILRFDPKRIFWPPNSPQINTPDQRFNFLNVHQFFHFHDLFTNFIFCTDAYGHQGVLMIPNTSIVYIFFTSKF